MYCIFKYKSAIRNDLKAIEKWIGLKNIPEIENVSSGDGHPEILDIILKCDFIRNKITMHYNKAITSSKKLKYIHFPSDIIAKDKGFC